jgi:hypothetical protein
MKYEIMYIAAQREIAPAMYTITCQDSEAKAFMQAINKELKAMEKSRIRELKEALKEGARTQPHRQMKKEKNKYSFDEFQVEDVCKAAQRLEGQEIRCSFLKPRFEITALHIEDLERNIDKTVKNLNLTQ